MWSTCMVVSWSSIGTGQSNHHKNQCSTDHQWFCYWIIDLTFYSRINVIMLVDGVPHNAFRFTIKKIVFCGLFVLGSIQSNSNASIRLLYYHETIICHNLDFYRCPYAVLYWRQAPPSQRQSNDHCQTPP